MHVEEYQLFEYNFFPTFDSVKQDFSKNALYILSFSEKGINENMASQIFINIYNIDELKIMRDKLNEFIEKNNVNEITETFPKKKNRKND